MFRNREEMPHWLWGMDTPVHGMVPIATHIQGFH